MDQRDEDAMYEGMLASQETAAVGRLTSSEDPGHGG
jgi:hypothetical protein